MLYSRLAYGKEEMKGGALLKTTSCTGGPCPTTGCLATVSNYPLFGVYLCRGFEVLTVPFCRRDWMSQGEESNGDLV